MPGISKKFPPEDREKLPKLKPIGALEGLLINSATGDVLVGAIAPQIRFIFMHVWDALGFLDIIDQQQAALQRQMDEMEQAMMQVQSQIQELQANINVMLNLVSVTIPQWMTHSEVFTGKNFFTGETTTPTAESLGLIVEMVVSSTPTTIGGLVMKIEPPAGTLVLRGSKVKVFHSP